MCGIAGVVGGQRDHRGIARELLEAVRHRGPDDEGVEHPTPSVTFVHTRLAILDTSPCGHQPMRDQPSEAHATNWVTFNGEIFNFLELREELGRAGHPCSTLSDTEVILKAYRLWGRECVRRFVGMFALCIYDGARNEAILYRDRLGIKPVYLYRPPGGGLAFASELRALLALGSAVVPPVLNRMALESFLAQGAVQGEDSLVEGVTLLPPGCWLVVDGRTGEERERVTYWSLPNTPAEPESREEAVARLGVLARDAVRLRLISDVPIGLFLSGGIDSAAMLALATEVSTGPLHTLSVGFDVASHDETDEAAATARLFGSKHQTIRLTGAGVLEDMPEALEAMDQPTVDGTNTYFVSRAARAAGLTVALSGLGGDELFGGYASFRDVPRALRLRRFAGWLRPLAPLVERAPSRGIVKAAEALRRHPDALAMYLLRRELFLPSERRRLHARPDGSDASSGLPKTLESLIRRESGGLDVENQVSRFEIELYMRHMLLRDGDVFSMAAPIEYRVPFLDHRLVEAAFAMPGAWKRPDPRPKPLLLDAVGPSMPAAVWQRPKRGFTFPWRAWLSGSGALAQLAADAASDRATWESLGMKPGAVRTTWARFQRGDARVSPLQVLAFVTLRAFALRTGLHAA